jgi:hypothetical protein
MEDLCLIRAQIVSTLPFVVLSMLQKTIDAARVSTSMCNSYKRNVGAWKVFASPLQTRTLMLSAYASARLPDLVLLPRAHLIGISAHKDWQSCDFALKPTL